MTMQFLSISQRRKGFAEEEYASLAEQEMERARELYAEGWIRQIWHRADIPGACLLWEAGERRADSRKVEYISVREGWNDGDVAGSTQTVRRLSTNETSEDQDIRFHIEDAQPTRTCSPTHAQSECVGFGRRGAAWPWTEWIRSFMR